MRVRVVCRPRAFVFVADHAVRFYRSGCNNGGSCRRSLRRRRRGRFVVALTLFTSSSAGVRVGGVPGLMLLCRLLLLCEGRAPFLRPREDATARQLLARDAGAIVTRYDRQGMRGKKEDRGAVTRSEGRGGERGDKGRVLVCYEYSRKCEGRKKEHVFVASACVCFVRAQIAMATVIQSRVDVFVLLVVWCGQRQTRAPTRDAPTSG